MTNRIASSICAPLLLALALTLTTTSPASAAPKTRFVSNHGLDGGTCGTKVNPCRSIRQAIFNAAAGDTIMVGPGFYGDVDGDTALGEPGEELAGFELIQVDKKLRILSSHGADMTVIEGVAGETDTNVSISASGAVFGGVNHGFTVRTTGNYGVYVNASDVVVRGTVVEGALHAGIAVDGAAVSAIIRDNRAWENDTGIWVDGAAAVRLQGNVAGLNGFGIDFSFPGVLSSISKNIAVGNSDSGISVGFADTSAPPEVRTNTAAGNGESGILLSVVDLPGPTLVQTLTRNNVFGNGEMSEDNCGLNLRNIVAPTKLLSVDGDGNFWGAASPGNNPADDAGGTCNTGNVSLALGAGSAKEIPLKALPMR